MSDLQMLLQKALSDGIFDPQWYATQYNREGFSTEENFADLVRRSVFDVRKPNPNFSAKGYMLRNMDIVHANQSSVEHYTTFGRAEGRASDLGYREWSPNHIIDTKTQDISIQSLNVALVFHIFYEEYIFRFCDALRGFPVPVDVYVTSPSETILARSEKVFRLVPEVRNFEGRKTPNRGRNFAPMLCEYAETLLKYDLFCHMHSKKSLYTGREQLQWSEYLLEYILRDKQLVADVLSTFASDPSCGLYFPRTIWLQPYWAHHWLKNSQQGKALLESYGATPSSSDFFAYPVGGMFWAKPTAITQLLSQNYAYGDFPEEKGQTDGTIMHAIERVISQLCESNGYRQFFYDNVSGNLTFDSGFIFEGYYGVSASTVRERVVDRETISFDVFDTILMRAVPIPDLAKSQVGAWLKAKGGLDSEVDYVAIRNAMEMDLRKDQGFKGDVKLLDVCIRVCQNLGLSIAPEKLSDLEFSFDLRQFRPRRSVLRVARELAQAGRKILFVSDTYYSKQQIDIALWHLGVDFPYTLYVSSEIGKRKDQGTIWEHIFERTAVSKSSFAHIGDNVVSDCQIPGDNGINALHILNPIDKWNALGLFSVHDIDPQCFAQSNLLWGKVASHLCADPFLP